MHLYTICGRFSPHNRVNTRAQLDGMPGIAADKAARLERAISRAATDMGHGDARRSATLEAAFCTIAMDMGHEEVSTCLQMLMSARWDREQASHSA